MNIIAEGPNLAIKVSEDLIQGMDEWNTKHHNESGLVERVRNEGVELRHAEQLTLEFLKQWVNYRKHHSVVIAYGMIVNFREGNEQVSRYLNYRMVDVSTIKELRRRWYPG